MLAVDFNYTTFQVPVNILKKLVYGSFQINTVIKKEVKKKKKIASLSMTSGLVIEILNVFSKLLIEANRDAMLFSQSEAKGVLRELKPVLDIVPMLNTAMAEADLENMEDYNAFMSAQSALNNLTQLIDTLNMIVTREVVNENDKDYQKFLSELVDLGLKSDRVASGNSLRELVDIE